MMHQYYCKECGNKLEEGQRFCPNCGIKVGGSISITTKQEPSKKASEITTAPNGILPIRKTRRVRIGILVVIVVVLLVPFLALSAKAKHDIPGVWISDTFYHETYAQDALVILFLKEAGDGAEIIYNPHGTILETKTGEYHISTPFNMSFQLYGLPGKTVYTYNPFTKKLEGGKREYTKSVKYSELLKE